LIPNTQVAELKGYSPQMVTRIFENEKGVLIVDAAGEKAERQVHPHSASGL
jgi:hypothetical protein